MDFKDQITQKILITGATGYVGGRLIPKLLEMGYSIRALGRSIKKLKSRPWSNHPNVELVEANLFQKNALQEAVQGCETIYYLVHSMDLASEDFSQSDRQAAQNMVEAAELAQAKRIIYLGGLGQESSQLSRHLSSRLEVARILKSGTTPVTILRAAMIIGSGSASFEILRYLVERLPIMVTPRWVQTPCQPIAIRNVLEYLVGCLSHPETVGETYDIGGVDILSYRELMEIYAEEAKLPRRIIFPLPILTPRLSSYWIHLVTPVPSIISRPLAEGLINPVICQDHRITQIIPQKLLSCRQAIRLALDLTGQEKISTHWSDAGQIPPIEWSQDGDPHWAGGTLFQDRRERKTQASPRQVWRYLQQIGGKTGWYHANWLWNLRGFMDRMVGGVGLRRGRRNQYQIQSGDALDFWRVVEVVPERQLLLAAEMKLPGKATLEFLLDSPDGRSTTLTQTARFRPRGLLGILYWYAILPFHHYIFGGMIRKITRQAEKEIPS